MNFFLRMFFFKNARQLSSVVLYRTCRILHGLCVGRSWAGKRVSAYCALKHQGESSLLSRKGMLTVGNNCTGIGAGWNGKASKRWNGAVRLQAGMV